MRLFILLLLISTTLQSQIPVVNGWSVFTPSTDSRLIYVSDLSGNDATAQHYQPASPEIGSDPFLPAGTIMPYKTINAAKAQLRAGFPDWILFKKGETWTNQQFGTITLSGRNSTEPMLIGTYGNCGTRPNLLTGTESLIDFSGASASFLVISGIHAIPHIYSGTGEPVAVRLISAPFNDVLLEDCFFEKYAIHIACHDPLLGYNTTRQNLKVRRCILSDAYKIGGGTGLFIANIDGILFEENIIDHNGWNESIQGANPTAFSHNTYFQVSNTNLVFQNNMVTRASATGGGFRCGGTVLNNLFVQNPKNIQFGTHEPVNGTGGGINWPSAFVQGEIAHNVILDCRAESFEQGMGLQVQRVKNTAVHHNIIAHFSPVSEYNTGILLNEAEGINLHHNLVYNWGNNQVSGNAYASALYIGNGMTGSNQINFNDLQVNNTRGACISQNSSFSNTAFSNNHYYNILSGGTWFEQWFQPQGNYSAWLSASGETGATNTAVSYPDPARTVNTYLTSIGQSGDLSTFINFCKQNNQCAWNEQYTAAAVNDYIRAGFDIALSLPVVLQQLEAQYTTNQVELRWETSESTALEMFTIQRSSDAIHWTNIGTQHAQQPSHSTQKYLFMDKSPMEQNYYRLIITESNGQYAFSNVVSASQKNQINMLVYPNPASNILNIIPQNIEVSHLLLRNISGTTLTAIDGPGPFSIPVAHLPPGIYSLEAMSENHIFRCLWVKN